LGALLLEDEKDFIDKKDHAPFIVQEHEL